MLLNCLIDLINLIIKGAGALVSVIFSLLPNTPFSSVSLSPIAKYLGYLNYIIPVTEILSILTVWGSCVGIYYLYQIALRWIKVVE